MKTSPEGIAALTLEEGDVLRAYRCPAGKWTIGPGLTAASGVVVPKPGMVITKAESARLTELALARNYEPAVEAAMVKANQHEFDAGVLFHWNTGAIKRAAWVRVWNAFRPRREVEYQYRQWNKGGGKVLPGLVKRRERELRILFDGVYPAPSEPRSKPITRARWALVLDLPEKVAALGAFEKLGYAVGIDPDGVPAAVIRKFQLDHALTADGVIGRATLSTLQRRVDASAKATPVALASVGAGSTAAVPSGTSDVTDWIAAQPWALGAVAALVGVWGVVLAWRYRDVLAAEINNPLPRVAAFLRSF